MENRSEYYYEKLKNSNNPGVILATYYCSLYETDVTRAEIIMFNRLMKTFGRFTAFSAVTSMYGSYPNGVEVPYPLLYRICQSKFEAAHQDSVIQSRESLEPYLKALDKDIESLSKKKLKIPSSEGL